LQILAFVIKSITTTRKLNNHMKLNLTSLKCLAALLSLVFALIATTPAAKANGAFLNYDGRFAAAPLNMPAQVQIAVQAANELQGKPYVWGGGHKFLNDRGYDCSGSVSYVLFKAGVVRGPMTSRDFRNFGESGPGRFITIYVNNEHVFISICGLRFDTSDHGSNRGKGPMWRPTARSFAGFEMRHPAGL